MTPAGRRKERLRFQRRGLDDNGDIGAGAFEDIFGRWGRVVARTRGEAVVAQRIQGIQPIEVTLLADSATRQITNAWRLIWKGQTYNITAVAPTEDNADITMLAQADHTNG